MDRKRLSSRSPMIALVALAAVVALAGGLAAINIANASPVFIVVRPSNMQGWSFFDDNGYGGSYGMVAGPASPPLGVGSANLAVSNALQGVAIGTAAHQGTRLDAISALTYSTYRVSGGAALAGALQFDIDYDVTDLNMAYQGRLTFEPYYTNTVMTGTWQTWNTLTGVGTGNWWATGAPGNGVCPIGNPCMWSEVLTNFPNAGLRNPGALLMKAGSGWATFQGSVDALHIVAGESDTTYDFEEDLPTATATNTLPPPTATNTAAPLTATSTPRPNLGGVAAYPDLPSDGGAGVFVFATMAAIAGAAALGGAVWYGRRRRPW
jgi:hypothetical protein